MRVGLLGGSFNPPHQGHVHISELAIKKLALDQVWWIPTKKNPLKEAKIYEAYVGRLQKCKKLIERRSKLKICDFDEIYTFDLLQRLKKKYPRAEFFWLMGADNLENFHLWKNFKKIPALARLTIFSREKFLLKLHKTRSWKFLNTKNPLIFFTKTVDISSSQIRKNNE